MIDFDICGIGTWSERFANADDLITGLESGVWPDTISLQPELIPPRERRRAPQFVRMAVEVMQQACSMAGMEPQRPAIVFASQMGDMGITDYMCRVLAESPHLLSPTKFHNSVHNAAAGYWSIASGSRAPACAIAAFDLSPSIALLEAAAQLSVECTPVLAVMQDAAAPAAFQYICPGSLSFAAAVLMTPPGVCSHPLVNCRLTTSLTKADWPDMPPHAPEGLVGNPCARILPLLTAAMRPCAGERYLNFPAGPRLSLQLRLQGRAGQ